MPRNSRFFLRILEFPASLRGVSETKQSLGILDFSGVYGAALIKSSRACPTKASKILEFQE